MGRTEEKVWAIAGPTCAGASKPTIADTIVGRERYHRWRHPASRQADSSRADGAEPNEQGRGDPDQAGLAHLGAGLPSPFGPRIENSVQPASGDRGAR